MSNVYALRIHELADSVRNRLIHLLEGIPGSYVVAREIEAERPHYQGWIRTEIKPQALRVRLKKAFPECVGNRAYSLKAVKDFEAYSRYILKGTRSTQPDIVAYQGLALSPEYIANEHRAYWSRAEKASKSNRSVIEEVHAWAVEEARERSVSRRDLAEYACGLIASRKKPINTFYVRGVINTVAYLTNDVSREIILDEIVNKY